MAELDHLVFVSPDVDEGVRFIEDLTGAAAVAGGPHVGRGSHNALLTFDERTYFEIIGIDPNQPDYDGPLSFGMSAGDPPGLVAYAVHPVDNESLDDLAGAIEAAGFDAGAIRPMSRQKPDGELLEWRLTAGGDTGVALQGGLPFAIDWGVSTSPAASLPSMGNLVELAVSNPNPAIGTCIAALGLTGKVNFSTGEPSLTATVATPNGTVTLSS